MEDVPVPLSEFDGMLPPVVKKQRRDINCEQCNIEVSKYTCPKCGLRSCSVACVKQHKEKLSCDGIQSKWKPVMQISKFTPEVSIGDQSFFDDVKQKLSNNIAPKNKPRNGSFREKPKFVQPQNINQSQINNQPPRNNQPSKNAQNDRLPRNEYLLQKNAGFRRISLKIDAKNETKGSHYETCSETIFWTIFMRFVQSKSTVPKIGNGLSQLAAYDSPPQSAPSSPTKEFKSGNEISIDTNSLPKSAEFEDCFTYLARDIPETVTVRTLIQQFVKPKKHGPIISRSDLDLEKMQVFLTSPDSCLVYMAANINGSIKYFNIDQTKSILENLRNRTINGHPEFIVALDTDKFNFEQPTQSDLQLMRPAFHQPTNSFNKRPQNGQFQNNRRNFDNQNRNNQNYNGRRY